MEIVFQLKIARLMWVLLEIAVQSDLQVQQVPKENKENLAKTLKLAQPVHRATPE
jgi:hypothetical protein